MVNQDFLSSSKNPNWETPRRDFERINKVFNFQLDAAATKENTKCVNFITPEMDAFKVDWNPSPWFLNPPWGKEYEKATGRSMGDWVRRIKSQVECLRYGVLLCAARSDTKWWQGAASFANYILFPEGRIAYIDTNRTKASQPTFPSCYMIYFPELLINQGITLRRIGKLVKVIR